MEVRILKKSCSKQPWERRLR